MLAFGPQSVALTLGATKFLHMKELGRRQNNENSPCNGLMCVFPIILRNFNRVIIAFFIPLLLYL